MRTDYTRLQKRQRLLREIVHFEQCSKFADQADSQQKRCFTIAKRCLKRRRGNLAKLNS